MLNDLYLMSANPSLEAASRRNYEHRTLTFAEMAAPGPAVAAMAAGDVPFAGNAIADLEALDFGTQFDDGADVLVADVHRDRDRLPRPVVPFPDMHVGPADGRFPYLDQDVVGADRGAVDVAQGEAGSGFQFCQGFHVCSSCSALSGRPGYFNQSDPDRHGIPQIFIVPAHMSRQNLAAPGGRSVHRLQT